MFETISGCFIGSTRYTNTAEILRQYIDHDPDEDTRGDLDYEYTQSEYGGGIERTWYSTDPDDPAAEPIVIPCLIRSPTATAKGVEAWSQIYENMRSLQMQFDVTHSINERDQVTNITALNKSGVEFYPWAEVNGTPTIFDVTGVSPIFGPFGDVIEWVAVLERAEVQDA